MNTAALLAAPEFDELDRHFARFIGEFGGGDLAVAAAAFLSRNIRRGHICLDLAGSGNLEGSLRDVSWPNMSEWQGELSQSRATGGPDDGRPLVLTSAGRLYLRRYWEYERLLAKAILDRCDRGLSVKPDADLQKLAIETALTRRFVVISGGPGTGKTTTVLKVLRRMVNAPDGRHLRIALAAPTGKAAARLQESLRAGSESDSAGEVLPKTVSTIHRLLGARHGSVYFRHHAKNPLPVDVVVVDEASMVALPMMAKLFDALPAHARVILLGDRYQLASVEPGAVLGEIADAASVPGGPLEGSLVTLQKNYRFGDESPIATLCELVRTGSVEETLAMLQQSEHPGLGGALTPSPTQLATMLRAQVIEGYSTYLRAGDAGNALREFQGFRVLCALRTGPFGVVNVNRLIEGILRQEGLITGTQKLCAGMPLLVTRNDYQLHLYNGDIGILLPDDTGALLAWFVGEDGNLRHISPARLPEHEPAFAMTVHKSQGSEFEKVLLLLPEADSPVLTRELVYTGLTRARKRVDVWYREASLRIALARQIRRDSGLRDALS